MTTNWPDDDRIVEVETPDDELQVDPPEVLDEEVEAELPLELTEDELRPDGPLPGDVTP